MKKLLLSAGAVMVGISLLTACSNNSGANNAETADNANGTQNSAEQGNGVLSEDFENESETLAYDGVGDMKNEADNSVDDATDTESTSQAG